MAVGRQPRSAQDEEEERRKFMVRGDQATFEEWKAREKHLNERARGGEGRTYRRTDGRASRKLERPPPSTAEVSGRPPTIAEVLSACEGTLSDLPAGSEARADTSRTATTTHRRSFWTTA